MSADRVEIGNCIIAGIAEGGTCLEQMSEIVTRLELAGFVIVPLRKIASVRKQLARLEALHGANDLQRRDAQWHQPPQSPALHEGK